MLALLLLAGCNREKSASPNAAGERRLTIFYTCDTRGHLHPCDCDSGKEGGIARRMSYLANSRPPGDHVLVSVGNVTAGNREWELLEYEYLLKAYSAMHYAAVNLGREEITVPAAKLKDFRARHGLLVSASLVDADGRYVVPPYEIITTVSGLRVAIVGLVDVRNLAGDVPAGYAVLPPDSALGKVLPELVKKADAIVVLAFADEETMTELAELFFEIDVIVGGAVSQSSPQPLVVNEALLVYTTDQGKYVGRLEVGFKNGTTRTVDHSLTTLTSAVADSPQAKPILDEYQQQLEARKFQDRRALRDDSEGLTAIGSGKREKPEE